MVLSNETMTGQGEAQCRWLTRPWKFLVVAALLGLLAPPLPAQEAGSEAPRWPDGHVNLGAAPGALGYWEIRPGGLGGAGFPSADAVPFKPWARALYDYRQREGLTPPSVNCKPAGGPGFFNSPGFEVVEVPELEKIFILNIAGPHSWRVIYMDGRGHPADLRPTYFGHSIGRWEGDTLVVDSVGFNEKSWIRDAYPTTGQLHMVERMSRPTLTSFVYEVTFDDPGAYTAPWGGSWTIDETTSSSWIDGGEMFEYICQDVGG